jgi:hypothetical protein
VLEIRPLVNEQVDEVVALWRACDLLRPWNDPHADIALVRGSTGGELFTGLNAGVLVASVMCGSDGHRGWLYYLAVSPERRGRGFGRAMVRHAESWLEAGGCPKVQLMIREENTAVQDFYSALGYEQESRVVMARRTRL